MSELREITDGLDDLYSITGDDWVLSLSHSLTEPTCPTAVIRPEGWNIARYRVDCSSIEESLQQVVALVRAEIIDRRVVGSSAPYTNSDDGLFAKWLEERAAGSDAKLPELPVKEVPEEFEWILDGFLAKHAGQLREESDKSENSWASYISASVRHYLSGGERLDWDAAHKMVVAKLSALKAAIRA